MTLCVKTPPSKETVHNRLTTAIAVLGPHELDQAASLTGSVSERSAVQNQPSLPAVQLLHPRAVPPAFSPTTRHVRCLSKADQGAGRRKWVHSQGSGTQGCPVQGFLRLGPPCGWWYYTVSSYLLSALAPRAGVSPKCIQIITLMLEFGDRSKNGKHVSAGNRIFDAWLLKLF